MAASEGKNPEPLYIVFPEKNCHHCGKRTTEIYQRTIDGKGYCIDCLNKGAGIDELLASPELAGFVSEAQKDLAKKNGLL